METLQGVWGWGGWRAFPAESLAYGVVVVCRAHEVRGTAVAEHVTSRAPSPGWLFGKHVSFPCFPSGSQPEHASFLLWVCLDSVYENRLLILAHWNSKN